MCRSFVFNLFDLIKQFQFFKSIEPKGTFKMIEELFMIFKVSFIVEMIDIPYLGYFLIICVEYVYLNKTFTTSYIEDVKWQLKWTNRQLKKVKRTNGQIDNWNGQMDKWTNGQLKWTNVKGVSRNPEMRWSENVSFLLINFLIQKFRTSDKLTFYLADFFINRSVFV